MVGGVKWTLKPPCNAQIRLTELFDKGEIKKETSSTAAYYMDKEFSKFTTAVFGNNFRKLRQLNGYDCKLYNYKLLSSFGVIYICILEISSDTNDHFARPSW